MSEKLFSILNNDKMHLWYQKNVNEIVFCLDPELMFVCVLSSSDTIRVNDACGECHVNSPSHFTDFFQFVKNLYVYMNIFPYICEYFSCISILL